MEDEGTVVRPFKKRVFIQIFSLLGLALRKANIKIIMCGGE
jgi:hypothetical protein